MVSWDFMGSIPDLVNVDITNMERSTIQWENSQKFDWAMASIARLYVKLPEENPSVDDFHTHLWY